MMYLSRRAVAALFAVVSLSSIALSGCGGGGGTGGTDEPVIPGRLQPNYAAELVNARRWEKSTVRVYIESPVAGRQQAGAEDSTVRLRDGFGLWDAVPGVPAIEYVSDPATADVQVTLRPGAQIPDGRIGHTMIEFRLPENVIERATIVIDQSLGSATMAQVAAHELGHTLGLDGHSQSANDLMFAVAHLPGAVTNRDANTMTLNYEVTPARENPSPQLLVTKAAASADTRAVRGTGRGTAEFGMRASGENGLPGICSAGLQDN